MAVGVCLSGSQAVLAGALPLMRSKGFKLSSCIYAATIRACERSKEFGIVFALVEEMRVHVPSD